MSDKIFLIGYKGNLGQKILNNIKNDYEVTLFDIKNPESPSTDGVVKSIKKTLFAQQSPVTLIVATPPDSHKTYIEQLSRYKKVKYILCEKPLPSSPDIKPRHVSKVRLIDHYLYKSSMTNIMNFAETNEFKKIRMFLCESDYESRHWMLYKNTFGGVTYDLAHHLLAITGELFGYDSLNRIEFLKTGDIDYFHDEDELADRRAVFSFLVNGVMVTCEIGKHCPKTRKQIEFYDDCDNLIKDFTLSGGVNYCDILSSLEKTDSKLLSLTQAETINSLLNRILAKFETTIYAKKIIEKTASNTTALLQDLSENFKHRHGFYWSSYYKLLIYYLSIIALPVFIYYYASSIEIFKDNKQVISGACLLLATFVFLGLRSFLKRAEKYLGDEDHRLKLVIDRWRELYLLIYDINLFPGDKQNSNSSRIIEKVTVKPGLGGDYMFRLFRHICYVASGLSVFLLCIIYLSNK
ncbi:MAG: Gfo/Idh/MocA family oxidoreductase [Pseudomonadales bacterium]|nr:Gfo/Idh/MocA family oxidoreductase [Pseudomonadales bacterium]